MLTLQNLKALILDSNVILTASRRVIKDYAHFNLIYNGSRLSYNSKLHYSTLNFFVKAYIKMEKVFYCEFPEFLEFFELLKSNGNGGNGIGGGIYLLSLGCLVFFDKITSIVICI